MTQIDQNVIADLLAALSDVPLTKGSAAKYIPLKIGEGAHSDVMNIYNNHVRCFVSEELRKQLERAKFIIGTTDKKNWFRIKEVSKDSVEKNCDLFKKIVKDSVDTILHLQKKGLKATNG